MRRAQAAVHLLFVYSVYTKVTDGQTAVSRADATMKMSTPGLHTEGFPVAGKTIKCPAVRVGGMEAGSGRTGVMLAWGGGQLGMLLTASFIIFPVTSSTQTCSTYVEVVILCY